MSHLVIGEVSRFLRHTLWLGIHSDPITSQLLGTEDEIVLTNPGEVTEKRRLSLWLYQVIPNEHLRNAPVVRRQGTNDDELFHPPLPLNLLYLLTPSSSSANDTDHIGDQQLLGRAMQIFHDQSILRLESVQIPDQADELHISLASRTIDELAQVWEAMQQPYRLSVCYEVRAVRISSMRPLGAGRVHERQSDFQEQASA